VEKLTNRQRGFVKDYIETGNATLAAKNNYDVTDDNTAAVIGSENLRKLKISETIAEALEAQGLTNDHLASKVAELVNAQRKITILRKGDIEAVEERVDTPAVKAGLEFAFKLKESLLKKEGVDLFMPTEEEKIRVEAALRSLHD